jgi:D-alanyl-D-alanine carboxypeptidase
MELSYMYDGYSRVDSRCYEDLDDMIDALYAEDLVPVICSSYRTTDVQQSLFDGQIDYFVNQGMSWEDARVAAAREVAVPGTSEHQLGLAVDIVDVSYPYLDDYQADTAAQKWLMEHCYDYGFILRYPTGTTEITGIIYEPWHYRYVGVEVAKDIQAQNVTLEEYLNAVVTE